MTELFFATSTSRTSLASSASIDDAPRLLETFPDTAAPRLLPNFSNAAAFPLSTAYLGLRTFAKGVELKSQEMLQSSSSSSASSRASPRLRRKRSQSSPLHSPTLSTLCTTDVSERKDDRRHLQDTYDDLTGRHLHPRGKYSGRSTSPRTSSAASTIFAPESLETEGESPQETLHKAATGDQARDLPAHSAATRSTTRDASRQSSRHDEGARHDRYQAKSPSEGRAASGDHRSLSGIHLGAPDLPSVMSTIRPMAARDDAQSSIRPRADSTPLMARYSPHADLIPFLGASAGSSNGSAGAFHRSHSASHKDTTEASANIRPESPYSAMWRKHAHRRAEEHSSGGVNHAFVSPSSASSTRVAREESMRIHQETYDDQVLSSAGRRGLHRLSSEGPPVHHTANKDQMADIAPAAGVVSRAHSRRSYSPASGPALLREDVEIGSAAWWGEVDNLKDRIDDGKGIRTVHYSDPPTPARHIVLESSRDYSTRSTQSSLGMYANHNRRLSAGSVPASAARRSATALGYMQSSPRATGAIPKATRPDTPAVTPSPSTPHRGLLRQALTSLIGQVQLVDSPHTEEVAQYLASLVGVSTSLNTTLRAQLTRMTITNSSLAGEQSETERLTSDDTWSSFESLLRNSDEQLRILTDALITLGRHERYCAVTMDDGRRLSSALSRSSIASVSPLKRSLDGSRRVPSAIVGGRSPMPPNLAHQRHTKGSTHSEVTVIDSDAGLPSARSPSGKLTQHSRNATTQLDATEAVAEWRMNAVDGDWDQGSFRPPSETRRERRRSATATDALRHAFSPSL